MNERPVVFLMYHELEEPGRALCQSDPGYVRYVLKAANFRAQMQALQREGWRGVCVGQAIDYFDQKSVAITFDDGSESDLLSAAPVLREFGFSATFYVTSSWLGKSGYLSPAQLRELRALGFEVGCHSMTHAYLTDLDENGLQSEIVQAKSQLQRVIGSTVEHFSCPGGRFDRRVARVASLAGYRTVSTSEIRTNTKSTDRFALGRIPVMRSTSLLQFKEVCSGRGLWRLRMSSKLREAGKRVLGNSVYERIRSTFLRPNPPSELPR